MEAKEIIFLDNTRISGCKGCPMYYCIKSKLGWVPSKARPPLDFGGSWHEGKAEIFREIKKRKETFPRSPIPDDQYWTDVHERAFESFMTEWHKRGLPDPSEAPEMMELYFPRVPGTAREMLWHYIDQNKLRLWEIEILDIERPFVVPLFETETQKVFLVGRRDLTYRDYSGVWAMEHKTSTLGAAAHRETPPVVDGIRLVLPPSGRVSRGSTLYCTVRHYSRALSPEGRRWPPRLCRPPPVCGMNSREPPERRCSVGPVREVVREQGPPHCMIPA